VNLIEFLLSEMVGIGQVGSEKVGIGQVGIGQVGSEKVGIGQVGSAEVGSALQLHFLGARWL
jgi:hypothetical protein